MIEIEFLNEPQLIVTNKKEKTALGFVPKILLEGRYRK